MTDLLPISQCPDGQAISPVSAAATITLNGCVIGGTTPKAATFTTVSATSYFGGPGSFATVSAASPILPSSGGTGLTTLTANNVILGNGASTPLFVAPSTSGNVLTSNGTTWQSSAAAGSGPLLTINASGASSVIFSSTYITSTYNKYVIEFDSFFTSNGSDLKLTVSVDNGSNYLATGYYWSTTQQNLADATTGTANGSNTTSISISGTIASGTALTTSDQGTIKFSAPSKSCACKFNFQLSGAGSNARLTGDGFSGGVTPINNIKLACSGTTSGNFHLYGISGT